MKSNLKILSLVGILVTSHNVFAQETVLQNLSGRTLLLNRDNEDSWLTFHDANDMWYSMGIDRSHGLAFSLNQGGELNSSQFVMNSAGWIGIGGNPASKLHVRGGTSTYSDPNYDNINIRISGDNVPGIRFTRWTGGPNMYHNAFIGQFYDGNTQTYSLGIGTGASTSGDQNFAPNAIVIPISGNVGIGVANPSSKLEVDGNFTLHGKSYFGGYSTGAGNSNSYAIEVGGQNPTNTSGHGTIYFHHHGVIANQLRYNGGNLYWEAAGNGYGTTNYPNFLVSGNVGIGITNPTAKLEVDGNIISEEIKVQVVNGPDYVFSPDYDLRTLEETKTYIEENKHLPEIPSAAEMEANGVALGEMNMLLLKKIEELTLYMIEMNKRVGQLETENTELKKQITK